MQRYAIALGRLWPAGVPAPRDSPAAAGAAVKRSRRRAEGLHDVEKNFFKKSVEVLGVLFPDSGGIEAVAVQMHLHQFPGLGSVLAGDGVRNPLMVLNDL